METPDLSASLNQSPPTMMEWAKGLMGQDNISTAFQFAKGATLIAAAALGGSAMVVAAAVGLIGIGLWRVNSRKNASKAHMVEQFRSELAATVHKDAGSVTVADLENAVTQMNARGEQNSLTLEHAAIEKFARVTAISGTITTIIMAALTATAFNVIGNALFTDGIGYVANSAISKYISDHTRSAVIARIGNPYYSLSKEIENIDRLTKIRLIVPEQVFHLFVAADPKLQQQIKKEYGDEYRNLPLVTKGRIVNEAEPVIHAKALANAINHQQIRASELGFLIYHRHSGAAPALSAISPAADPMSSPAKEQDVWVQRIREQPNMPNVSLALH